MDPKSILMIEKDRNLGRSFYLLLEGAGHGITIAVNYQEAIRSLQQRKYHAILVNQQSLDPGLEVVLSHLHDLVKERVHLIFLISDSQTIPRLPQNDHIDVTYVPVPVFPEDLLGFISSLHSDRTTKKTSKLIPGIDFSSWVFPPRA